MCTSTRTFVAVDAVGRQVGQLTVAATCEGHLKALVWARREFGDELVWAIEDCRHLSARLERDRELVEHITRGAATPHLQRELGMGGVGEASYAVELGHPIRRMADREVQYATATDRRQLMPVADQHHRGGQAQQGPGSVLIDHARLADDQKVAGPEARGDVAEGGNARPSTVRVPAKAVLMQQPGGGVRRGTERALGDLRSLTSRSHHDHSLPRRERVESGLGLLEDLSRLGLGVCPPQHPLPRLAVAGGRAEHTWYFVPPSSGA
jgi:hypothetical protein